MFNLVSWRSAWETCLSLAVSLNHMDIISSIYVFLLFAVVATGHLEGARLNAHVPPICSQATPLCNHLSEHILKCWWFSSLVKAQKRHLVINQRMPADAVCWCCSTVQTCTGCFFEHWHYNLFWQCFFCHYNSYLTGRATYCMRSN